MSSPLLSLVMPTPLHDLVLLCDHYSLKLNAGEEEVEGVRFEWFELYGESEVRPLITLTGGDLATKGKKEIEDMVREVVK